MLVVSNTSPLSNLARQLARERNLKVSGVLGELLHAKEASRIASVREEMDRLQSEARFFIREDLKALRLPSPAAPSARRDHSPAITVTSRRLAGSWTMRRGLGAICSRRSRKSGNRAVMAASLSLRVMIQCRVRVRAWRRSR